MIYTCPKCGKKMDISTEVLINSEYKVICPQCLCQLHIVGDYAYIPNDTLDLDTSVKPSHTINCPKCGHEANSNAHFCPNCGTSFDTRPNTAVDIAPEDVTVLPPPMPNDDPLYQDALQFLGNCISITPMMLRDHFQITDERAAELIRQLEARGAIGPYNNGGPRQILIPHAGLYEAQHQNQWNNGQQPGNQGTPQQNVPTRRKGGGLGCVTYFVIIVFIVMLVKSCGG